MTLGELLASRFGPEVWDAVAASPEALALARGYFPDAGDPVARLLSLGAGAARALRSIQGRARRARDAAELSLLDDEVFRGLAWRFLENRP